MIRPATLTDVETIFGIAIFESRKYEQLLPDAKKIRRGIVQAISSAKHFVWVSVDDQDRPNGVLIGLTSDNLWAQRSNCFVALWTTVIVGDGRKLLKEFIEWVQLRRIIRVAGFVSDTNNVDQRAYTLVERMGFRRYGSTYLMYN